jgi:hypothetical protein
MGQIPADVVPVVISEKARMAQEAANLRAAQQVGGGDMPTVIEQAMRANAQQEMPRAAETGVAGIPLGPMFQEKNFKSGGIVAFQSGGVPSADPFESQDKLLKDYRDLNIRLNSPADFKRYADALRKEDGRTDKDEGYRDSDIRRMLSYSRDRIGALINTAGPSDEMSAGEAEARLTPPTVPLERVNLDIAGATGPQAEPAPPAITAAQPAPVAAPAATPARIVEAAQPAPVVAPAPVAITAAQPAAPVAPVAQPAAQPPAGLAAALTGRTSTAEGDEGVAEAQAAARRAAAAGQTPTVAPKGFEEVLANIRRAYGGSETANITPERKAYLDMLKAGSMSQRDMEKQRGMRFLQAGLGVLGGQSPYALRNIAEGSKEALQGYAEDLKAQRTQKLAEAKSAAEIADLRRAEQRQEVNTALDVYGKQLDREQRARLAAERTAVADRFARNYAAKMRKAGDQRSMEDLLDEGYVRYLEEAGQAQERIRQGAATAAGQQGVQLLGQDVTRSGQAIDARATAETNWTKMPRDNPIAKEYRRLARQDKENAEKGNPTNLAETYKNNQINAAANRILAGQSAAPTQSGPAAGAAAPAKPSISAIPGAPSGSSVGNFVPGKGWEIKDKDGKLLGYGTSTR